MLEDINFIIATIIYYSKELSHVYMICICWR